MLGLYIHIPFCNHICGYCDFYKMVVSNDFKQKYIDFLIDEMNLRKIENHDFDTIYIGGGTPSSLPFHLLEELLKKINEKINMNNVKEFTIEVNPEDICFDLINLFIKYNINRISIGIQSFSKNTMKTLKRTFVPFDVIKEKVDLIKSCGITNISCDLIYGVIGETIDDLKNDLEKLINLNIPHISTYSLILEEKTILFEEYKKNKFSLISDELDESMYKIICNTLKEHHFVHYETSNFGKEGYSSFHNLKYWNCEDYIGIGAGASSLYKNKRFTNIRNIEKYYEGINSKNLYYEDVESLSIDEQKDEMIMLGLRKIKGINKNTFFNKFNVNIKDAYKNINELISEGLLEENDDYIFIPEKYSYIANHIIIKII